MGRERIPGDTDHHATRPAGETALDVLTARDPDPKDFGYGNLGSPELYLDYSFRSPALLRTALTHSSRAHERSEDRRDPSLDNEQLEFLGDAVLNLLAAQALLEEFPNAEEGNLTRLRSSIVSREHLAPVARRLQLGRHMLLGRGEDKSGGRRKPALLADALEAVIAAIYLDGGLEVAREFVKKQIVAPALPELRQALASRVAVGDYKTELQERLQAEGQVPRYLLLEETGPDHLRSFRIAVAVEGRDGTSRTIAEARGTTKKQAQQRAAGLALQLLGKLTGKPAERATPVAPELEKA